MTEDTNDQDEQPQAAPSAIFNNELAFGTFAFDQPAAAIAGDSLIVPFIAGTGEPAQAEKE